MALYKRGNTWHCDFTVNGQRVRRSTKESAITRARAAESELVQQALKYRLAKGTPPLLRDLAVKFLAWVENCTLDPGTKKYYRNGWRLLKSTDLQAMRIDRRQE